MCYFVTKYYLLQKRYDRMTMLFFDDKIALEDYKIFIEYYESQQIETKL